MKMRLCPLSEPLLSFYNVSQTPVLLNTNRVDKLTIEILEGDELI